MAPKELVERLRLNNPRVVEDVYAIANRQLEVEDRREASLSTKATTLLTASGVSLTFVLGFAALFAQSPKFFEPLPRWGRNCVLAFYAISFIAGLVASIFAADSLRVRESRTVSEADVFGDILRDADAEVDDTTGTTIYRRYLVAHLWQIYTDTFDIHEARARALGRGQAFFVLFLVALMPPAAGVVYALAKTVGS